MRPVVRTLLLCTLALVSCTKKKDRTPPVVTTFSVPAATATLSVPITALTATDENGVTGFLVTESALSP